MAEIDAKAVLEDCWREVPGLRRSLGGLSGSVALRECRWCLNVWPRHKDGCPITALASELARREAAETSEELAWGLVANSPDWGVPQDGGPCGDRAKQWREAAIRWRDAWHICLTALAASEDVRAHLDEMKKPVENQRDIDRISVELLRGE